MEPHRAVVTHTTRLSARRLMRMEDLAHAQQTMLVELEQMSRGWFARRHDGAQATTEAMQKICSCGDVGDALQANQRWLAGSVGRIAADTIDAQAHGAKIAKAIATGLTCMEAKSSGGGSPVATGETAAPSSGSRRTGYREAA